MPLALLLAALAGPAGAPRACATSSLFLPGLEVEETSCPVGHEPSDQQMGCDVCPAYRRPGAVACLKPSRLLNPETPNQGKQSAACEWARAVYAGHVEPRGSADRDTYVKLLAALGRQEEDLPLGDLAARCLSGETDDRTHLRCAAWMSTATFLFDRLPEGEDQRLRYEVLQHLQAGWGSHAVQLLLGQAKRAEQLSWKEREDRMKDWRDRVQWLAASPADLERAFEGPAPDASQLFPWLKRFDRLDRWRIQCGPFLDGAANPAVGGYRDVSAEVTKRLSCITRAPQERAARAGLWPMAREVWSLDPGALSGQVFEGCLRAFADGESSGIEPLLKPAQWPVAQHPRQAASLRAFRAALAERQWGTVRLWCERHWNAWTAQIAKASGRGWQDAAASRAVPWAPLASTEPCLAAIRSNRDGGPSVFVSTGARCDRVEGYPLRPARTRTSQVASGVVERYDGDADEAPGPLEGAPPPEFTGPLGVLEIHLVEEAAPAGSGSSGGSGPAPPPVARADPSPGHAPADSTPAARPEELPRPWKPTHTLSALGVRSVETSGRTVVEASGATVADAVGQAALSKAGGSVGEVRGTSTASDLRKTERPATAIGRATLDGPGPARFVMEVAGRDRASEEGAGRADRLGRSQAEALSGAGRASRLLEKEEPPVYSAFASRRVSPHEQVIQFQTWVKRTSPAAESVLLVVPLGGAQTAGSAWFSSEANAVSVSADPDSRQAVIRVPAELWRSPGGRQIQVWTFTGTGPRNPPLPTAR